MMLDRIPKRVENIIGTEFGDGCVVIGYIKQNNCRISIWLCKCKCGREFKLARHNIVYAKYGKKCCPKCSRKNMGVNNTVPMIGKRFGRWVVLKESQQRKYRAIFYLCECDCGTIKEVSGTSLRKGVSQSCGCFLLDVLHGQIGNKNPHWNPNLTDEERQMRKNERKGFITDRELKQWRLQVFERDNYTCECCGTTKSPFNAHHLNGWKWAVDQR